MPDHRDDSSSLSIDTISVIERLVKDRKDKAHNREKVIENIEEWKKAINRICGTHDGQLLIKYMIRHNGLYNVDNSINHAKMIEDNGKKKVYLELIRPFLKSDIINKLENQ